MDSKKIGAIVVVVVVIAAAAGGLWYYNSNKDKGETLGIAYLNLSYYPFMIGFHDGWFDDLPFNVEPVVVTGSGQDAINAVLAGEATMAATGEGPFVNMVGKYGEDMIGLAQYTHSNGSLSGHYWLAANKYKDMGLEEVVYDADEIQTNSKAVADDIKAITASGQGATDGRFTILVNDTSTTMSRLLKWFEENGLTYDTAASPNPDADIRLVPQLGMAAVDFIDMYQGGGIDAVAMNSSIYEDFIGSVGDQMYVFGDSSSMFADSYSVFCTTKENYDMYKDEMMQILDVLKDICDWIKSHPEESAQIINSISGAEVAKTVKTINDTAYEVKWDTGTYESWVDTAKTNGYTVTAEQFIQACPHRDIINSWYSDTAAAA